MEIGKLIKDNWQQIAGGVAVLGSLVGFLWRVSKNILRAQNTLEKHEKDIGNHERRFKNTDSSIREISLFVNFLTERVKPLIEPEDRVAASNRIWEILNKEPTSSNPVTPEERERFEKYRQKAMFGQPFATSEYEDFKALGEKFTNELPLRQQAEFADLLSAL